MYLELRTVPWLNQFMLSAVFCTICASTQVTYCFMILIKKKLAVMCDGQSANTAVNVMKTLKKVEHCVVLAS